MQFSPAIHPDLIDLLDDLDDGTEVIAAIWRELGRRARGLRLVQPSYESVRRLVHAQRERRKLEWLRLKRATVLAFDILWRLPDPRTLVLDLAAGGAPRRRRPRDGPVRARPPTAA
jgi:hypothetical protein